MAKKNFKEVTRKDEEFEQRVIDLARVTRVMAGGKRMKFRACLAIGDRKGRVGFGVAKGADVTAAVTKALNKAKKNLIKVTLINETIPHEVKVKFKSAKVILKPAQKGNGVKAGGPVRILCELAGISNITAKILGSGNKINNVKAVMIALQSFKHSKKADKLMKEEAVLENKETNTAQAPKSEKAKEEKKSFKEKIKNLITKTKEDK